MLSRSSRALATALKSTAFLVFALASSAALAHAQLQKAVPAVGGTVTASPREIRLKFSEGVEPRFSGIALAGPDGAAQPIGAPGVDPADNSVLVAAIGQTLKPGIYKVTWHVVSVDTHKTQGGFNFTLAP
jgi:methionine-rich copper-binding protein CopC